MLIKWSDSANADMAEILTYFTVKGETETGKRIISLLLKSARRLRSNPLSGRPGRISGTREIVIRKVPYILVYQLSDNNISEVVRVIHTARLWPEQPPSAD